MGMVYRKMALFTGTQSFPSKKGKGRTVTKRQPFSGTAYIFLGGGEMEH
jgi:hypothetical protein